MGPPKPRTHVDWEKQFTPREFTAGEWENQRQIFTRMYLHDNLKLPEVRKVMAQVHGFYATKRQFDRKIKQWGLKKNLKKKDALGMLKIQERRKKEGKSTDFKFNGNPITQEKLMRHIENGKASEWESVPSPVATPNFVVYWTPKTCDPEIPSEYGTPMGGDTPSQYGTPMGSDTPRVAITDPYSPLYSPGACDPGTPSEYTTPAGGDTPRVMTVDSCSPRPSFSQLGDTQNVRQWSPNANAYPLHPPGDDVQMEDTESAQLKAVPALDLVNENHLATNPPPSQIISSYPNDATRATLESSNAIDVSSVIRNSSQVPEIVLKMSPPDRKPLTRRFPRDIWKEKEKEKALRLASSQGHVMEVRLLVERGTDISAVCENGWTPLHEAAFKGHKPVVLLLLEKGADISAKDLNSYTPLHLAAKEGHETVVRFLLESGADISTKDSNSYTPLHLAAKEGHETVVRFLLESGADISAKDSNSYTPLYRATDGGHETVVRLLLKNGADVSVKDSWSSTPLHRAALRGHETVVRLLLENGADISARDLWSSTPLHKAVDGGHELVVQLLLENGADVSARDSSSFSYTPLHLAAWGGHGTVVRLLLENGADVSARDSSSYTPLHLAASGGHETVVRLLLKNGADVSAKDSFSETPLHMAASRRDELVVRLLLENGADVSARDSSSVKPYIGGIQRV